MKIAQPALDDIIAHARQEAPLECCGVLLGVADRIAVAVRGRNLEASPVRFQLDPLDHIAARRQARAHHQQVLGFYHSHPSGTATPSSSDVAETTYEDVLAVIVGLGGGAQEVRAFAIANGTVREERLEIDDASPGVARPSGE